MQHQHIQSAHWSTSSYGDAADTSPMDLTSLHDHLLRCKKSHSRLFKLRCMGESVRIFFTARVVTTLCLAAILMGTIYLVL